MQPGPTAKTTRSAATTPTAPARRPPRSSSRATATRSCAAQGVAVATRARRQRHRRRRLVGGSPDPRRRARLAGRASVAGPPAARRCARGSMCWSRSPAICTLAQQLWERPALAGAYNFGPDPRGRERARDRRTRPPRLRAGRGAIWRRPGRSARIRLARFGRRTKRAIVLGIAPVLSLSAGDRAHHGLVSRARAGRRCAGIMQLRHCRVRGHASARPAAGLQPLAGC